MVDIGTRRTFLSQALAAGAGASLYLAVESADAGAAGASAATDDPGFAAGQVVAYDAATGVVSLVNEDLVVQALQLGSGTQLWKDGAWNDASLSTGDCLYARGTPDGTTISADRVWVDVGMLDVTVVSVASGAISVILPSGETVLCAIAPSTSVLTPTGMVVGSASALRAGQGASIVGYGDPAGGTYTASVIYPWVPATDSDPAAQIGSGPDVNCSYYYYGLASYFCCGGVQGCHSNCSDKGSNGACGDCKSTNLQCAWPTIPGCDYTCGHSCNSCCTSLPQLPCGKQVTFENLCNSRSVAATVVDCGPCVRCVGGVGCDNYKTVKFDLTPCAFSAIGDLATGLLNVRATVFLPC